MSAVTARYWVAKYIEDPLRNEPRNVGVIVRMPQGVAARFAGENEEGVIDRRKLQRFKYADIYTQWLDYWRGQIERGRFDDIVVTDSAANYYVVLGGEVADTGNDTADMVCNFLFSFLVSDGSMLQAFELAEHTAAELELPTEVSKAFAEMDLLSETPTLSARHPIQRNAPIRGGHAVHKPSFSQSNGRQYIYETIDFNIKRPKSIKERSGWMAYMFKDIKQENPSTETFSIVRPTADEGSEATEYATAVLGGDSKVIDWRDDAQRKEFLNERQRVAESFA
ncbi:MAG TPA: hypothetical protein VH640_01925 [Bryobacteraceae bacterium]